MPRPVHWGILQRQASPLRDLEDLDPVINKMMQENILTYGNNDKLKQKNTEEKRKDLIDIIRLRPYTDFVVFLEILETSDYAHIAKELKGDKAFKEDEAYTCFLPINGN